MAGEKGERKRGRKMPVEMKMEGRGRAADEVEAMLPSDGTWKTFTFFTPPLYVFV